MFLSLEKFFKNLEQKTMELQHFCNTTNKENIIVHPEVYSNEKDARKAHEDFNFRALFSKQKELMRKMKDF